MHGNDFKMHICQVGPKFLYVTKRPYHLQVRTKALTETSANYKDFNCWLIFRSSELLDVSKAETMKIRSVWSILHALKTASEWRQLRFLKEFHVFFKMLEKKSVDKLLSFYMYNFVKYCQKDFVADTNRYLISMQKHQTGHHCYHREYAQVSVVNRKDPQFDTSGAENSLGFENV